METYRVGYRNYKGVWIYRVIKGLDKALSYVDDLIQEYDNVTIRRVIRK